MVIHRFPRRPNDIFDSGSPSLIWKKKKMWSKNLFFIFAALQQIYEFCHRDYSPWFQCIHVGCGVQEEPGDVTWQQNHYCKKQMKLKYTLNVLLFLWLTLLCLCSGAAVVSQQSLWRVNRHWEAVSQSAVHSQDIHQVWEILCRTPGHDQRQGELKHQSEDNSYVYNSV